MSRTAFFNPHDINYCFTDDFIYILPHCDRVECLVDYILENHLFESEMRASFSFLFALITNGCVSFHYKFNSMFYSVNTHK